MIASNPYAEKTQLLLAIPGWLLSVLLALIFLSAGGMKLMSRPNMVQEFAQVGLGQWFRYFTGILEVAGAIMAHLTALHSPPTLPAILLAMVFAAAWLRRL